MTYAAGQRYTSLSEPELGIGLLCDLEERLLKLYFPSKQVFRTYEIQDAPVRRVLLSPGQQATSKDGQSFFIEKTRTVEGCIIYCSKDIELHEKDLSDLIDPATPENRLLNSQVDPSPLFELRQEALNARTFLCSSPLRGFLGGRIQLFPHQLFIASEVCKRHQVRVMLADEVGLGKTIEAALIIHRLLLTQRIERVLILTPPALVHQWFAELYLRFNLTFRVCDQAYLESNDEPLEHVLSEDNLMICPLDLVHELPLTSFEWDLCAIDEAHHIETECPSFSTIQHMSESCPHMLLLSATPERSEKEGAFLRMNLLDPHRFYEASKYHQEQASYNQIASLIDHLKSDQKLASEVIEQVNAYLTPLGQSFNLDSNDANGPDRKWLIEKLLDLHGTGRMIFRNVRQNIGGFPKRIAHPVALEPKQLKRLDKEFLYELGHESKYRYAHMEEDPRVEWLADFMRSNPGEKVVVLCHNHLKVEAFAHSIETRCKIKVATFHEKLTLLERDRKAAWFNDPAGSPLLISSPLGAEGRNFQCSRHLILIDLPINPDALEQRIGRLDRIGQGPEVHIHILFQKGSLLEKLYRWHNEALKIFSMSWHGSPDFIKAFNPRLEAHLCQSQDADFEQLLLEAHQFNKNLLQALEKGRDHLLEMQSYRHEPAEKIERDIELLDDNLHLEEFMLLAFERSGIDVEATGNRSYSLLPNELYTEAFPGFRDTGMVVTFDRITALKNEDRTLLTWDHPMVRDALELILGGDKGNAALGQIKGDGGMILEASFILESTLPASLHADRFLPPTPLNITLDHLMKPARIKQAVEPLLSSEFIDNDHVQKVISKMVKSSKREAEKKTSKLIQIARQRMHKELDLELTRLKELSILNQTVTTDEIAAAEREIDLLEKGLNNPRLRLDSLRLILVQP